MTVRTRADLDQLPAYVAGRTVPGSIKLASNEVSAGPLPSVVEAITRAATEVHRYPDMASAALIDAIADRVHVSADRVAVGCGSVALCEQLVQATCTPDDEVMFPWRSFEAYPIITHVVGAQQVRVPLTAGHALDLDAMAAAVTPRTRLIFVCTPNNPTGTTLRSGEVERFIQAVPSDVVVVIDEAYFEFMRMSDAPNGIELAEKYDNVVSLRTFSKAYGLAGLRAGYSVSSPKLAETLRKVCTPFSVNALAQTAAIASLDAQDELKVRCDQIAEERVRVRRELLAAGFELPESESNFIWLPLGERATTFNEHCLDNKVVLRPFAGDGVRVTIGDPHENDAFLAAAKSFPGS